MSNDKTPRARLGGFDFITAALGLDRKLSCSAGIVGGTMWFTSPELMVPTMYDKEYSPTTPEADIYAFGMVIFQVCERD